MNLTHFCGIIIKNFSVLIFLLLCEFAWGLLLLSVIKKKIILDSDYMIYSLSIGHGIIAHLILFCGYFKIINKFAIILILIIGIIFFSIRFYKSKFVFLSTINFSTLIKQNDWFSISIFILLLVSLIFPLLSDGFLPPNNWDEVAYHLAIPKIYIKNHGLTYIPFIPYSNWPLETEMVYIFPLLFNWELVPHLINWTCLLLICFRLYSWGKKYFSANVGLISALLFATTPMIEMLAGTALIELPLTLFTILAITTLIDWFHTNTRIDWVLSAVFGGIAASTKLNAALVPFILAIVLVLMLRIKYKTKFSKLIIEYIKYGLVAFLIVSPWYFKSLILTGNPFWPFLYQFLPTPDWDQLGMDYLMGFIRRPNMPMNLWYWIIGFFELILHKEKYGPYRISLNYLYIYFLPLFIFSMFLCNKYKKDKTVIWLIICCIFFYTSWFFQTHQTRFLMPVLPMITLLLSIGIDGFHLVLSNYKSHLRIIIQFIILVLFIINNWILSPADRSRVISRLPYLLGKVTKSEFIISQIPEYKTFIYANKHLPKNAKVLLALYEVRGYYLDREYVWANPISQRYIKFEQFDDANQLAEELEKLGFTHIIFRSTNIQNYTYIKHGEKITNLFLSLVESKTRTIYQSDDIGLYKLLQ